MPLPRSTRFTHAAGFTLVELLIVLSIIGILASVSMATYRHSRVTAGEATAIRSKMNSSAEKYFSMKAFRI